jgi:isopenicillin N synthase-like dioxygenase
MPQVRCVAGRFHHFLVSSSSSLAAKFLPPELEPLCEAFQQMGAFALQVLSDLCGGRLPPTMGDNPLRTVDDVSHSTFWECFHYECDGPQLALEQPCRVACAEHCDTGVLTVLPAPRGLAHGFECFDWARDAWVSLDIRPGTAIVFAGELFRFATTLDVAPLCHRVVLPVQPPGCVGRWSMPFELLPTPGADLVAEVYRLGKVFRWCV